MIFYKIKNRKEYLNDLLSKFILVDTFVDILIKRFHYNTNNILKIKFEIELLDTLTLDDLFDIQDNSHISLLQLTLKFNMAIAIKT